MHVPFIAHLNRPAALRQRRLSAKTQPSYAQSWQAYIRGNLVSRHQQRIIVAFMSVNSGKSSTDAELEANMDPGS